LLLDTLSFAKIRSMKLCFSFFFIFFASIAAQAYPEFIGYGYSSCLTCHVNGQGSGPLNDYGRALWSAEIASRLFYPKSMSDEDIAAQSGFAGSKELPYWIRPHIKYREMHLRRHFQGPNEQRNFYRMQEDFGATFQDATSRYLALITIGNLEKTGEGTEDKRFLPREYYIRTQIGETWWLYVGLMEKVYGIRGVDHSSYQRKPQGFNYNFNNPAGISQSQGVMLQKVAETWELTGNAFIGNPYDDPEYKQKGFGFMGEFEVGERRRLGASTQSANSDLSKKNMYGVHYRQGLSKGSGLLFEYGLIQDEQAGSETLRGSYNFLQTMILMTRGYNFRTQIERYNQDFKASQPDIWRWSVGILAFPMPRFEYRLDFINGRSFSNGAVPDDDWSFLGQIHVSL
jgi:hypothetical protein